MLNTRARSAKPTVPPMFDKAIAKQLAPLLVPKAKEFEHFLLTYLRSVPLANSETHATCVVDTNQQGNSVEIVVAAFSGLTFSREVKRIPVVEFIKNLNISEILK